MTNKIVMLAMMISALGKNVCSAWVGGSAPMRLSSSIIGVVVLVSHDGIGLGVAHTNGIGVGPDDVDSGDDVDDDVEASVKDCLLAGDTDDATAGEDAKGLESFICGTVKSGCILMVVAVLTNKRVKC